MLISDPSPTLILSTKTPACNIKKLPANILQIKKKRREIEINLSLNVDHAKIKKDY
jgi:hypothetical protein